MNVRNALFSSVAMTAEVCDTFRGACNARATADSTMLSFRRLDVSDLPALLALQEAVRLRLQDPDLYQTENEAYLGRIIAGSGAAFGAFDGNQLVGYGVVSFPGVHADNLCYDVPHVTIDLTEVAHLDGSGVDPDYRGLGIQQRLSVMRVGYAA